ncbi:MAG: 5-dehydro-2-deoxygluconokinase, partial [Marivivens sp.]|nr:5-dehydro-2-deoxygluconokinase [Marivivens sp.]
MTKTLDVITIGRAGVDLYGTQIGGRLEDMGSLFIREQLVREGVNVDGVITDPDRLTALVILGIRDEEQFPLIFYRENCADMALCEADIDERFIASARSVLATGTHLSNVQTEAAVLKALELARKHGARTALDIDYRPNLWGVAGHGDGESRFV